MELRHLRYFVGVAEELSFTRAARKLRVAQPALSRQIRQLEDEVGVALLLRDRSGVQMTESGQAFLVEAKALLEQSEHAIRAAQQAERKFERPFNVGYVWGLFHSLLPPILDQLRVRFPHCPVNLLDLTAARQAQDLYERQLDAGFIGFAHEADTVGLMKRKVAECRFVAVLPLDHPAARKTKVPLALLAKDFFFTISDASYPGASRFIAAACAQSGLTPKVLQAAERGFTVLGLVASNRGVAILPESLRALPHPGVVFRPLADFPQAELYLACNRTNHSPVLQGLLELLPE
jgi:DNA-binding transcriptional LysR family regulator